MTRDWDAAAYERVSDPQYEWGLEVLERLSLRGDERVLDAGCGAGRVTAEIVELVPRGSVVAVDASPSMVELTAARLGDRVETAVADISELTLDRPVDAVVSTAVFHWIPDHTKLFAHLHACLSPGGVLEAQCGGEGNVANVRTELDAVTAAEPFARYLGGWAGPWNFAAPAATGRLLEAAGFRDVRCWLEGKTITSPEPRTFLATVTLGSHLDRLPPDLRDQFVDAVAARLDEPLRVDYVRLNISARRAG